MEVGLQFGHITKQKATVLTDAVATQGGGVGGDELANKGQGLAFGFGLIDATRLHPRGEPRVAMGVGVPLIHARQGGVTLMNRQHRSLRQDIEFGIGDDGGDLDNPILVRIESGHLQIDPHQVVGILCHLFALNFLYNRAAEASPAYCSESP